MHINNIINLKAMYFMKFRVCEQQQCHSYHFRMALVKIIYSGLGLIWFGWMGSRNCFSARSIISIQRQLSNEMLFDVLYGFANKSKREKEYFPNQKQNCVVFFKCTF